MSAAMAAEVVESGDDHSYESFAVCPEGFEFDIGAQIGVAASDSRRMEVDIHTSEAFDEPIQPFGSIFVRDIQSSIST